MNLILYGNIFISFDALWAEHFDTSLWQANEHNHFVGLFSIWAPVSSNFCSVKICNISYFLLSNHLKIFYYSVWNQICFVLVSKGWKIWQGKKIIYKITKILNRYDSILHVVEDQDWMCVQEQTVLSGALRGFPQFTQASVSISHYHSCAFQNHHSQSSSHVTLYIPCGWEDKNCYLVHLK